MTPREIVKLWVEAFNNADAETIAGLYAEHAIKHQVNNDPIEGRNAIRQMFATEFSRAKMTCVPENIFEDGEWGILEWKDPKGLRGCGFFRIIDDKIRFQRGYVDKLTFHILHSIPL